MFSAIEGMNPMNMRVCARHRDAARERHAQRAHALQQALPPALVIAHHLRSLKPKCPPVRYARVRSGARARATDSRPATRTHAHYRSGG